MIHSPVVIGHFFHHLWDRIFPQSEIGQEGSSIFQEMSDLKIGIKSRANKDSLESRQKITVYINPGDSGPTPMFPPPASSQPLGETASTYWESRSRWARIFFFKKWTRYF